MTPQNDPDANSNLKLTNDIQLTSNTASDDRWKKTFGYISARPHEYLLHIRRGKIVKRTTGQAGRCFKFPSDTVVIIPTSLKQLIFETGQLTLDNIFIRLRGFAIYRISSPEKIYERISFWDRQSGERKLALMIGEQCRSHGKWLMANMTLEDCLRKRKEAIADALLYELRKVITEEAFGVSIETIDVQDVKIAEPDLFTSYQNPARAIIFKSEQLSELERIRDIETIKLKQKEEISEKEKDSKLKVINDQMQVEHSERAKRDIEAQAQRQIERDQAEHKRTLTDLQAQAQRQTERDQFEHKRTLTDLQAQAQRQTERDQAEHKRTFADFEAQAQRQMERDQAEHKRTLADLQAQAQRQTERDQAEHKRTLADLEEEQKRVKRQKDAAVEHEISLAEQQLQKQKADLEMEIIRERYNIDNSLSPAAIEKIFLEKSLPEIAKAIASSLSDARITIYQGPDGGSGLPFSIITNEIIGLLQSRLNWLKGVDLQDEDE